VAVSADVTKVPSVSEVGSRLHICGAAVGGSRGG